MPARKPSVVPHTKPAGVGFYLISGVLIVGALQGILYLYVVGSSVGPFTFFKTQEVLEQALMRDVKVALLRSELTAALFYQSPEVYQAKSRHWERTLRREGISYGLVSDAQLAKGLGDATVLVLPDASCLSSAEKQTVENFLKEGRGVVASGPVGARDERCLWQGWGFLQQLTGIEKVSNVTPPADTSVAFKGQLYFSEKIPAGYRLQIPSQELTVATAKGGDAFWTDWRLRPAQGATLADNVLAVHLSSGPGRVVWFGFEPRLPVERVTDQSLVDHYLKTSTLWAGKQPLTVIGTWPEQKQVAAIVAEEVGQDYNDALGTTSLFKQQEIPAIFICASEEAKKFPDAVKSFQSVGEVAAAGDSSRPFAGELPLQQAERLRQAKQTLETLSGSKVVGFDPPQALSDGSTVEALNEAGYRYYLNEMAVSEAVPDIVDFTRSVFFPMQKSEVLKIFRTTADDFEVIASSRGQDPSDRDLVEGFLSDFRRLSTLGGVYPFYFHSYLLGSAQFRNALAGALGGLRGKDVWLTSGRDLATWWSGRNKLETKAHKLSVHRIQLDVANTGQSGIKDVSVYLYLPYRPKTIDIGSPITHLLKPKWTMLDRDNILRIDFANVKSQAYYTYQVKMDE